MGVFYVFQILQMVPNHAKHHNIIPNLRKMTTWEICEEKKLKSLQLYWKPVQF